jgi:hypothetical protein
MACKCPQTTGGAGFEIVAAPVDTDNRVSTVAGCPPGQMMIAGVCVPDHSIACPPGLQWDGTNCIAPLAGAELVYPDGATTGDPWIPGEIRHTRSGDLPPPPPPPREPEDQPFPWLALAVGVGAVFLAAGKRGR